GDRARVELSFTTNVEEVHPERDRGGESRERERRRRHHRLRERTVREKRGVEQTSERVQRRMVGCQQDDGGGEERDDERAERHGHGQPPRLLEAALDPDHADSSPPAISRPSSSTVAVAASRSPTMAPSYMTTMRSASAKISSKSPLIISTPAPCVAAAGRMPC